MNEIGFTLDGHPKLHLLKQGSNSISAIFSSDLTLAEVRREAKRRVELSRSAILVIPVSRKESGSREKQTFLVAKKTPKGLWAH